MRSVDKMTGQYHAFARAVFTNEPDCTMRAPHSDITYYVKGRSVSLPRVFVVVVCFLLPENSLEDRLDKPQN